ncbi:MULTISPECIES: hypothetical protein [unclassified Variovorax]|uniref:hypothetical protein n=1 Tax=unclassified Variovorax TaxID=663243 RepID=UPI0013167F9F|nr:MULTISPECIES: hypothetical protein [unclassified Variovorax]VTU42108.1 hypothetical protein SRS16P1_00194 [Variovorax sp. SRS16]VTU42146.1 hypothetical protein E5P1_00192 [Variovorax sp. PBL-E5]VTU44357.1 hypothetical protein H6P1_00739 [Variovorax sp. PBL-H6]
MTHSDMAIAILQKTNDGDDLSPSDLHLLEGAVNGRLTSRAVELFEAMHRNVTEGTYATWQRTYLAPHLTKAPDGNVYWKGIAVEHYSFPPERRDEELTQARMLAARCQQLEAVDIPVNSRTVLCADCYDAPTDSPWKQLLGKYYSFMRKNGHVIGLFHVKLSETGQLGIAAVSAKDGVATVERHLEAYDAFHHYQRLGFESQQSSSYDHTARLLEALGLQPDVLKATLAADSELAK